MTHFKKEIPFNDLPLLPPKVELETKKVLLKTISASRALAQLNGHNKSPKSKAIPRHHSFTGGKG